MVPARESLEEFWRQRLEQAAKCHQLASANLQKALEEIRAGLTVAPDGSHAVRKAPQGRIRRTCQSHANFEALHGPDFVRKILPEDDFRSSAFPPAQAALQNGWRSDHSYSSTASRLRIGSSSTNGNEAMVTRTPAKGISDISDKPPADSYCVVSKNF